MSRGVPRNLLSFFRSQLGVPLAQSLRLSRGNRIVRLLNITRDIAVVGSGGTDGTTGASGTDYGSSAIVLKASGLDSLNAESILVGGTRRIASNPNLQNAGNQTYIVAATAKIVVDNGVNAPLQAPEIILASSDRMVGAQLISGNEERAKPARTTAPSIITTEMLGLGSRR